MGPKKNSVMLSIPAKNSYRLPALFIILIILGAQWGFYKPYTSQFPTFQNSTSVIYIL
jgi:hypothetical protein